MCQPKIQPNKYTRALRARHPKTTTPPVMAIRQLGNLERQALRFWHCLIAELPNYQIAQLPVS
jgi:hypothetical protein